MNDLSLLHHARIDLSVHRERQERPEESAPVVSVDLPDPWDPLDWLDPLVSPDVRYENPPLV